MCPNCGGQVSFHPIRPEWLCSNHDCRLREPCACGSSWIGVELNHRTGELFAECGSHCKTHIGTRRVVSLT